MSSPVLAYQAVVTPSVTYTLSFSCGDGYGTPPSSRSCTAPAGGSCTVSIHGLSNTCKKRVMKTGYDWNHVPYQYAEEVSPCSWDNLTSTLSSNVIATANYDCGGSGGSGGSGGICSYHVTGKFPTGTSCSGGGWAQCNSDGSCDSYCCDSETWCQKPGYIYDCTCGC